MENSSLDFHSDAELDDELPDTRHGARRLALQALYWEVSSPGEADAALQKLGEQLHLSPLVREFAAQLVHAVQEHRARLEDLIAGVAPQWPRERMARLDRLILCLALAEMLYLEDIPPRVSIDEAIQLAKVYSTWQSYAFINGVLDAVVRQQGLVL